MNRRKFLFFGIGLLSLSGIYYYLYERMDFDFIPLPNTLNKLCNNQQLTSISNAYRKMTNSGGISILADNLMQGITTSKRSKDSIENAIEHKITSNFISNEIAIVEGWILSVTEAQQCTIKFWNK